MPLGAAPGGGSDARPIESVTEFSAMFDEQSFLFTTGRYVLIYRRKNGDVLGISEPFEIQPVPEDRGEEAGGPPDNPNH